MFWETVGSGAAIGSLSITMPSDPPKIQRALPPNRPVCRGGAWNRYAIIAQCSYRYSGDPAYRNRHNGFRMWGCVSISQSSGLSVL